MQPMDAAASASAEQFERYRPLMFSIAYRMLSSATEAEDIVQEAYLRYQAIPAEQILSHKAFLSTMVTRMCLNYLQLAQVQRERYIGPWLPEPVLTEHDERLNPTHQAELHESLSMAFLTLLEQLTPLERAVFLLREVFDYDYTEIAAIVDKEEATCRQLLSRARRHVAEGRPRFKPSPEVHRRILGQFFKTLESGDVQGLQQLLTEDVTMWADGGGKARGAATQPLQGREAVSRFLAASTRFRDRPVQVEWAEVNGEPAVILRADEQARVVLGIGIAENADESLDAGVIHEIRIIGNPDKLNWLNVNVNVNRPANKADAR